MIFHMEIHAGYRVSGLQEREDDGWRIATWPEAAGASEKHYWVKDGQFHTVNVATTPSLTEWQSASAGDIDTTVEPKEREAVLNRIASWDRRRRDARGYFES
jgi:hypothetical protein